MPAPLYHQNCFIDGFASYSCWAQPLPAALLCVVAAADAAPLAAIAASVAVTATAEGPYWSPASEFDNGQRFWEVTLYERARALEKTAFSFGSEGLLEAAESPA